MALITFLFISLSKTLITLHSFLQKINAIVEAYPFNFWYAHMVFKFQKCVIGFNIMHRNRMIYVCVWAWEREKRDFDMCPKLMWQKKWGNKTQGRIFRCEQMKRIYQKLVWRSPGEWLEGENVEILRKRCLGIIWWLCLYTSFKGGIMSRHWELNFGSLYSDLNSITIYKMKNLGVVEFVSLS